MKTRIAKILSAVICIAVVFLVIAAVRTEISGKSSSIICYYNDRAWSLSGSYPVEENTSGVYYVPLTLFVQLPDVTVRINETLQTFIITHGDLYLSFDTVSDFAANQDKQRTPIATYERHGERYVPVEIVCAYLELGFEKVTSPANGAAAIRITDGNQEYSFSTLLRRKHPGFYPTDTTASQDTEPITPPTPVTPTLTERVVYITVEDSPGEYTDKILDVLEEYGYSATFFVVGNKAKAHIDTLSRIAAGGHTIALHTMDHDASLLTSAEAILDDIEAENDILSRIIKQKSRIWRAPDGGAKLTALDDDTRRILEAEGYTVWDANVEIPANYGPYSAANWLISGIRKNEVSVLRLTENANTAAVLRRVLDFIKNNRDACEVRVISPAYEEYIKT